MTSSTMKILPLLFLLIIQVMNVFPHLHKPMMSPNETEKIINEGESIELNCIGDARMEFHYPNITNSITNSIQTNSTNSNHDRQYFRIKFVRRNAISDDTGYYGCAYHGTKIRENIYNQSEASWVYIYVQSKKHLFVTGVEDDITVYVGSSTVIPCRPTFPYYPVTLYRKEQQSSLVKYREVELRDRITFDPKFGFVIKNAGMLDDGRYKCQTIRDGINTYVADLIVDLRVDHPSMLEIETAPQLAVKNKVFELKCRIYGLKMYSASYQVRWITPNGKVYDNSTSKIGRITPNMVLPMIEANMTHVSNVLSIKQITLSDAGNYICQFLSGSNVIISKNYLIKVYDPEIYSIKLTRLTRHDPTNDDVTACFEDTVTLKAKIDALLTIENSKLEVKWTHLNNKEIYTDSEKYNVTITENFSQLVIKKVGKSDDHSYFLTVSNIINTAELHFRLIVWCNRTTFNYEEIDL